MGRFNNLELLSLTNDQRHVQCAGAPHSSQVQQTQYGNRNSHGLTLPLAYVLLHLGDSNTFLQHSYCTN